MLKKTLLLSAAVCLAARAASADIVVPQNAVKSLSVTVYNNGLGLVKESRPVVLPAGESTVSFQGVSAEIQPETALFEGDGFSVREQNFNFDLLSRESLLRKYLGKDIKVIETHYASGKKTIENAKVLSVDAGLVLKIGDRIETDYNGRLIFPDIPADLHEQPTLSVNVNASADGERDVRLSYLTNGLTWRADYVAELNDAEDALNLNGWVTLTNTSGIAYKNADIQFVAGSVNRVAPAPVARPLMKSRGLMMAAAPVADNAMAEERLMDYHLYTLGRKTEIASNQTKQLALLSASKIKVKKEYKFTNLVPSYHGRGAAGEIGRRNADVVLRFDNSKASNLGLPLPAGTIRVYKANSRQNLFFVGEDRISHTPENGKIKLNLGSAFDVSAEGRETAYTALSDKAYEAGYSLTFKNGSDTPVKVAYRQDFPYEWSITDSSVPYTAPTARQSEWTIAIPAKGSTTLTFTVRVKRP